MSLETLIFHIFPPDIFAKENDHFKTYHLFNDLFQIDSIFINLSTTLRAGEAELTLDVNTYGEDVPGLYTTHKYPAKNLLFWVQLLYHFTTI